MHASAGPWLSKKRLGLVGPCECPIPIRLDRTVYFPSTSGCKSSGAARPRMTLKGRDFPPSFAATSRSYSPNRLQLLQQPRTACLDHPPPNRPSHYHWTSTAHAHIRPSPGLSPTGHTSQAIPCILSIAERHHRASRTPCAYIISLYSPPGPEA